MPGPAQATAPDHAIVEGYAVFLYTAVGQQFPTERFLGRLARDRRHGNPLVAARADIRTFVSNNPDFHLQDTPIEALLTEHPSSRASRTKDLSDPNRTV